MVSFIERRRLLMRVGFTLLGSMRSAGGYYYLLNLVQVLLLHASDRITPVLLVGDDEPYERLAPFHALPCLEIRRSQALNSSRQLSAVSRSLVFGRDSATNILFRLADLDLVFEAATFFGWCPGCRVLPWFPDFQHRSLPELFTRAGWWRREFGFRVQAATRQHFVVSSEDACRSAELHYLHPSRLSVVRFALPPPKASDEARVKETVARYRLPSSYFFMPNQFWRHKNHLLVIKALVLLAKLGHSPTVLASGSQSDFCHTGHVAKVRDAVSRAGQEIDFRMPGLLPREDIAPLLLGSTGLLNPSLYEGWSSSVEEAKAAGVPMLLSDLEVHREQAEGQAVFFARHDPSSLADALRCFPDLDLVSRCHQREIALKQAESRIAEFANSFVRAAQLACQ